jgi:ribulose-phosphate 3-epimerase
VEEALKFGIMGSFSIAGSIICGNIMNLKDDIKALEAGGADYVHFDVMDGVFVPRYGLYSEMCKEISKITSLPIEVHMMVQNPEPYIESFANAGAKVFYVHVENNNNLHRTLRMIRNSGMKAGVVLNIATSLEILDYILDDIDSIMLMGINPGIVGHKIIPKIYDKISDTKKKIGSKSITINIDGGVSPESSTKMIRNGADILVCGSSTIFRPQDGPLEENVKRYRKIVEEELTLSNGRNL